MRTAVRRALVLTVAATAVLWADVRVDAQRSGRFLGREDIILLGLGLRVEPAHQTVPKDIATIVSTFLGAPTQPGELPPFAPNTIVKGTLRGPSLAAPLELTTTANSPFTLPPLNVAGTHTLDNIRLESNGQVLLYGTPEIVTIEVIEKLLVTQVTSRPLTAAEIREKGIVFDKSSFQAYNFTAAFAIQDNPITIDFPVVLPTLQGASDVIGDAVTVPRVDPPGLKTLATIIPDTLKIQTQVPNLSVIGFQLALELPSGQELFSFPIPGVVIVPGNIGFLNQFFSVMLMVGNVAPNGSGLVVTDLVADIILPSGRDDIFGSPDDPLRMARTEAGETRRTQPIVQAGGDGKLGTADDILSIGPGESGSAEYLVEGRREGTHVVEMEMAGTLNGLPIGPVPIRGRAAGSVLVRNPTFTLTFTHPDTVAAGEPYTLDVIVTNTSESPANFVSVNLFPHNVSGASLVGESGRDIETIPPGDSATVSFDLVSRITGRVTAATLDSDENVAGRFGLKTAVGELDIPVSPDSLILPKEARTLPRPLLDAAVGMLGKAWSVATAPAGALPAGVSRLSKQVVLDRAVEVAGAGFRVSLHEPLPDSAAQLAMDFMGSDFSRLAQLTKPTDLPFVRADVIAFDQLRRASVRGDVFARAVGHVLRESLAATGVEAFHRDLAEKLSYRPGHLAVLAGSSAGVLPVRVSISDAGNRRLGGIDSKGKVRKDVPFSDFIAFENAAGAHTAEMAIVAAPEAGAFVVHLSPIDGLPAGATYTVSVVVPDGSGGLRHVVYSNLTAGQQPAPIALAGSPYSIAFSVDDEEGPTGVSVPSSNAAIVDPAPRLIGVVQQATADMLRCLPDYPPVYPGRVIALLFSEEVTPESAQDKLPALDITRYRVDGNAVVGVALQPGRRIVFLALRDPIGPFVPRQLTVSDVRDGRGQAMAAATLPIEVTVTKAGGVVSGQVLDATGKPVAASVRLFYYAPCQLGISSKNTDEQGRFSWDYVLKDDIHGAQILAVAGAGDETRRVNFTVQRDGQRLNVNVVLLGRGSLAGRTVSESGQPLAGTKLKVTSLTDHSQYGTTSDADGHYSIGGIPVGNVFVEAVNVAAHAQVNLSEHIPVAGGTTKKDIVLLDVERTQVTLKTGALSGHVLRANGATPAAGVPVIVRYFSLSQPGVQCPPSLDDREDCPIAVSTTNEAGRFEFPSVTAGRLTVETFDQATLQQGAAGVVLAADGAASVNVLLSGGLGTVTGAVIDSTGSPIAGARVGGGLTLVTTDANGEFVLTDVPVGRREIVAVSDALGSRGSTFVDLVRGGESVRAVVILESHGSVSGKVMLSDGSTPARFMKVYLFKGCPNGMICIVATATTDVDGAYRMDGVPLYDKYTVSVFNASLTDGNIAPVALRFKGQVVRADVKFRGGGGRIVGRVFDDDGVTPLRARVGLSGDRVVTAGGLVGTGFRRVTNFAIADSNFTTGEYAFDNVLVGAFTLSAVGQFSPDPISLGGEMPAANATVTMDLRLQPTSVIGGTVLTSDGVTPAGANVIVRFKSDAVKIICSGGAGATSECKAIPQGIQEEVVATDAAGRYLLPIVNAGPYTLTAEDPRTGRVAQVKGIVRAGETAEVSIRLLGVGQLTVEVLASDAVTPIPGARVEVAQLDYPKAKRTFLADASGKITFLGGDAFTEGDVVITATDLRNGFAGKKAAKIVSDGQQLTVKVFLFNATGRVSGTIFQADGLTPAPNTEVVISNCVADGFGGCSSGGPLAFLVADASGHYEQDQIPLGDFSIEVFDATTARRGFATGRIDFNGQNVPVNVVEAALGLVSGHVLASGTLAALKGGELSLVQRSPAGRTLPALRGTSGVDGSFAFPGVSLGAFTINVRVKKPEPGGFETVQGAIVREGESVDLPIVVDIARPVYGTLAGRVVNANGTAAANSQVTLCYPGLDCFHPVVVTADGDGRFQHAPVPLGRFRAVATSQTSSDSGSIDSELEFEGETTDVTIVLGGLRRVTGTVVFFESNQPAANVEVTLSGLPTAGCELGACTTFTDGVGRFSFVDVRAEKFTVSARHVVSGLKGSVGGALNPGEQKDVRVVLQPASSVSGRVLFANGQPAPRIIAELKVVIGITPTSLFTETAADGTFGFDTAPVGNYELVLQDSIGAGVARRLGTATGAELLGDITLDESTPVVASSSPPAGATGVPQAQTIQLVFSEPIDRATIVGANISLTDGTATVPVLLNVGTGDLAVTLSPLDPLKTETRYAVRVRGVKDRIGKVMASDYVLTFTTVDLRAPEAISVAPGAGVSGATVESTVRIVFSEPFDVAKLHSPPLLLTDAAGPVQGRLDLLLGNTVMVFSPLRPLARGASYRVVVPAVTDLSGNTQPTGLDYTFSTTDGSRPELVGLSASNNGTVIENSVSTVVANTGTTHDVAVVDFYLNDVIAGSDRSAPFEFSFQATPALGAPGAQIKVSALATDTSGNRGQVPAVTHVTVTADQPPAVSILTPVTGTSAKNGDRIVVQVRATDDLGVVNVGYRAQTGKPQDAANNPASPAVKDRTDSFAFFIPADAGPGAVIRVDATTVDTKGQITQAAPIELVVVDAVDPIVTITGLATGARLRPGQQATAVVSAQDIGGIASISFRSSGATAFEQTRAIDPALPSVAAAYTFTIPANARPGDVVNLDATAVDKAGNAAAAARLILPIIDESAPTVILRTSTGSLDIAPGSQVTIIADVADEIGVTRVDLAGDGAFTVTDAKQITPPLGTAQATFIINVPAGLAEGSVLNLRATATDISNNVSTPVTLALTTRTVTAVTMPASVIIVAGEAETVPVTLAAPAPAGGVTVTFTSRDTNVAQPDTPIHFAEGETAATLRITGIAGGLTTIDAQIGGVQRASMTATVRGGVVSGRVLDQLLNPVSGAQVTIVDAFSTPFATVTDGDGNYFVDGVNGGSTFAGFTIRAVNPTNGHIAVLQRSLSQAGGFARLNLILIAAGGVQGTVLQPDGKTSVGEGVRIDIFRPNDFQSLATTFTNDAGEYDFPLVTLGSYVVEARATNGGRGRASIAVLDSGETVEAPITLLGRGTVVGTVLDGANQPVPNAELKFTARTVFGYELPISVSAQPDGTFRFENVPVGEFQLEARNPIGGAGGSVAGRVDSHEQQVTRNVVVASYASLQGTVYRHDGVTPVPNADVSVGGAFAGLFTRTDEQGRYRFEFVRLGTTRVDAFDRGTSGRGFAVVTLSTNAAVVTQNITMVGQGSIVATVVDFNGAPVAGAVVEIRTLNELSDGQPAYVVTGIDGKAIFERILVGPFRALAWAKGLLTVVDSTLAADEVKPLLLQLQPTASVAGVVYEPDGQTPASAGHVYVHHPLDFGYSSAFPMGSASIGADGTFRIDDVRFGTYNVTARDAQGRLRALVKNVVLDTPAEVENLALTLIGLGTVNGRVLNPDSSSAPNLDVEVRSLTPTFGNVKTVRTDAAGFYEATDMVAGPFTVSTGDASRQLLGEGAGQIAEHAQAVTVDVLLQNNAVTLPINRWDGNNQIFQLQRDGSIAGSGGDLFSRTFQGSLGGMLLDVVVGGTPQRFVGATVGTVEEGGREVVTRQQGIGGLNVTRKAFVPRTGYFGRYLEILTNPTAAPITVDVRVSSVLPRWAGSDFYRLVKTSSGDAVADISDPDTADRWVILDDDASGAAATAFVFDGADAAQRAELLSVQNNPDPACQFFSFSGCYSQRVQYQWNSVTIEPGASVAFVHFLAQQRRQTSAVASAERLVQLPPEALAGLSALELGLIRNFSVPADGNSVVAPLPSVLGTITGTVFETDGVTPVRSTVQAVRFTTSSAFYDVEQRVNSDAQGRFTITATLSEFGNSTLVPTDAFTLVGRHPTTNLSSPAVAGSFADGALTTTQNVVFSQSVLLRGFVRRQNDVVTPTATLAVTGPNVFLSFLPIASDGSYLIGGLPAGALTITASLNHPQGSALQGIKQVQAVAGDVITTDVKFPPTGAVSGVVRTATGAVAPNATVRIQLVDQFGNVSFTRSTITDTSGGFLLTDAPAGASLVYRIEAVDPVTTVATRTNITLVADTTITQNLQLTGSGTVQVDVTFAGGAPAANASVTVRDVANNVRFVQANASGRATIVNVPVGAFTVEAQHPTNFAAKVTATGTMGTHGQLVAMAVALPATGRVQVQVTFAGGAPAQGASIELATAGSAFFQTFGSTDANGRLTINNVLGGVAVMRARHPLNFAVTAQASGVLTVEGQTLSLAAILPPIGRIQLQVNSVAGTPVAGSQVLLTDAYDSFQRFAGTTDGTGRLTVNQVRGTFDIMATDPLEARFNRHATGAIQTEGETVPVTIVLGTRGTVHGTVFTEAGVPTGSVQFSLVSEKPEAIFNVSVAADGTYSVADVPVGRFRIRATQHFTTPLRAGSVLGTVATHGESVTSDVHLTQFGLPTNLTDANGYRHDIDRSGSVGRGALSWSSFLQVGPGTSPSSFIGDFAAVRELSDRQLVIENTTRSDGGFPAPVGGVHVVRKVYVPPSGYFTRYLDVLENRGAAPVNVTVRLQQALNFTARAVATSSGDDVLTTVDQWMILRDLGIPQLNPAALVFQGTGATHALGEPTSFFSPERPFVGWRDVTLAPGERAIFMHFALSQADLASAQSAAERLAALPPEALVGIDAADRPAIRNFAVPADGSSTVAPFGTVSGRVLTAAMTPVPRATVLIGGSAAPLYKATIEVQADAEGRYVANTLDEGPFTVQARDPLTGVVSPITSLSLAAGEPAMTHDVVFAASGALSGTVRYAAGQVATSGNVRLTGGSPAVDITAPIGGDGRYVFNVLAPGTYTATATVNTSISRFNTISGIVVNTGAATVADITLRAQVDLRVTIKNSAGEPVPGLPVRLIETLFPFRPFAVTDAAGIATFASVGDGAFTLQVYSGSTLIDTFNGTVLPADDGKTVDYAFTVATTSIVGTVRLPNGSMASSGTVQISPDGFTVVAQASIASNGSWIVPAVFPGTYRANTLSVPGLPVIFTPFFTVAAGETAVVDIKYPASASVRLTATSRDGAPLGGLRVQIQDAAGFRNAGTTSASGEVVIANVTEGPFTVFVLTPNFARLGSVGGEITTANHGAIVDVVFEASAGSISGHVYGRDGTTALPDIYVELRDAADSGFVGNAFTAADGSYRFDPALIASGSYKVIAYAPDNRSVEATGVLAAAVVVDLTLPVVVMQGTVTYHDGTPAAGASVTIAQPRGDGTMRVQQRSVDADGRFTALVGNGEVEVEARDAQRLLEVRTIGEVTDTSTPAFALVLPPAGAASGAVLDAAGQPATGYISGSASASGPFAGVFASGASYAFERLPLGGFAVQVCDDWTACTATTGRIASDGQVVTAIGSLPAKGSVSGIAYGVDGVTPLPSAAVMIFGGSDGPSGQFELFATADGSGAFAFNGVPVGPVTVVMFDATGVHATGAQTGQLEAGTPLTLNVTQGSAVSACYENGFARPVLQGADGFRYAFGCIGTLVQDNTSGAAPVGPYDRGSMLRVNGASPSHAWAARVADNGRTRIYGPFQVSGVEANRKVFVPEAGGFVRFLDTLTNSSGQALTLDVASDSDLNGIVHVVVDPSTTGNTYAITRADATPSGDGQLTRSVLGHVFGGVGANVTANAVAFEHMLGDSYGRWTVTIPAGESVTLMHFSVQRAATDAAGATAQAQALVNLTDPNMLANMTAEEKARVVNFRIP